MFKLSVMNTAVGRCIQSTSPTAANRPTESIAQGLLSYSGKLACVQVICDQIWNPLYHFIVHTHMFSFTTYAPVSSTCVEASHFNMDTHARGLGSSRRKGEEGGKGGSGYSVEPVPTNCALLSVFLLGGGPPKLCYICQGLLNMTQNQTILFYAYHLFVGHQVPLRVSSWILAATNPTLQEGIFGHERHIMRGN